MISAMVKRSALALGLGVAATTGVAAQSVEEFYKGRSVVLYVPASPGGINDISARLVSRNYGRFIAGAPTFVVQNVPGGGGLVAANRLANTSERDGSVLAIIQRGTPQLAVVGNPKALFDPQKLTWLGSLSDYDDDAYLVVVNADAPATSAKELRSGDKRIRLGGNQPGSTNLAFALLVKNALKLNVDVVRGYRGAAPMFLAMQRGELDGQVIGLSSVLAGQPDLWREKKITPIIQFARKKRHPDLPDTPTARELTDDPKILALLEFAELPFEMALPFVAPPGLPPERTKALREGFMKMVRDKEFLAEAERLRLTISPIDGEAVEKIVARTVQTPKDVVELYNKMATPHD